MISTNTVATAIILTGAAKAEMARRDTSSMDAHSPEVFLDQMESRRDTWLQALPVAAAGLGATAMAGYAALSGDYSSIATGIAMGAFLGLAPGLAVGLTMRVGRAAIEAAEAFAAKSIIPDRGVRLVDEAKAALRDAGVDMKDSSALAFTRDGKVHFIREPGSESQQLRLVTP